MTIIVLSPDDIKSRQRGETLNLHAHDGEEIKINLEFDGNKED